MSDTDSMEFTLSVVSADFEFGVTINNLLIISNGAEFATGMAEKTVRLMEKRHNVRGKNAIQVESLNDYMSQTKTSDILNHITIFVVAISSSVAGIFFGIYPARKAAQLSPIEALRHE